MRLLNGIVSSVLFMVVRLLQIFSRLIYRIEYLSQNASLYLVKFAKIACPRWATFSCTRVDRSTMSQLASRRCPRGRFGCYRTAA
jgi:hypothetical protein